jgi:hypothetical protein
MSAKGGRDAKDKTNLEVIAENEERDDLSAIGDKKDPKKKE